MDNGASKYNADARNSPYLEDMAAVLSDDKHVPVLKASRSLKALKSTTRKRHGQKDLKQSVDQMIYLQHHLPSTANLN